MSYTLFAFYRLMFSMCLLCLFLRLFCYMCAEMPDIREYLTSRQVVAIYGVERSTLCRLAKLGRFHVLK